MHAGRAALAVAWLAAVAIRVREACTWGMWPDEFLTLWAAHGDGFAGAFARAWEQHPQTPLYYLVVHASLAVFGDSELAARLPSLVAGALLPVVAYAALAPRWGRRAGAAAFVLIAFNPRLILHAAEARPYALAELGVLLSLLGLSRLTRDPSAGNRALAWGGALLAVVTHYVFAPVGVALAAGILLAPRTYSLRAAAQDAALTAAVFLPAGFHMIGVFGRRADLSWAAQGPGPTTVVAELLPGWPVLFLLALLALTIAVAQGRPLTALKRRDPLLGFALAAAALTLGALGAFSLSGTNLFVERYLMVAALGLILLAAWTLPRLPAPVAAIALVALAVVGARRIAPPPSTGWRAVAAELDSLEPRDDEPILLWQGLIDANLLPRPEYPTPALRGWLSSPLSHRPGRPRVDHDRFLLLTSYWGDAVVPGHEAYLRSVIVPAIADADQFYVVGHYGYLKLLSEWLAAELPGRFRVTYQSRRPHPGALIVLRFSRA